MIDLITGHQGIPHISAEQISTLHRSLMGTNGDNKVVRMKDGGVTSVGLTVSIATGYWRVHGYDMQIQEAEAVIFDPTEAGYQRIDDLFVEILQDISSGVQRSELVIVQGEPSAIIPTAPAPPTEAASEYDLLVECVPVCSVLVIEGAMTMTDLTIPFKASSGDSESLAPEFDPERPEPYEIGEIVEQEGKLYIFIRQHSGPWDDADVEETTVAALFAEVNNELSAIENVYGAKNLIPYPIDSFETFPKVTAGITFSDGGDGKIIANGTASGNGNFAVYFGTLKKGTYTLTGVTNIYNPNKVRCGIALSNWSTQYVEYGEGVTFTISDESIQYIIYVGILSGVTVTDEVFKPMLRLASIQDDTWVPYVPTNKELMSCKLNGYVGAKNLLAYPYKHTTKSENGVTFTDNGDGTITVNTPTSASAETTFYLSQSIQSILDTGMYILSGCPSGGNRTSGYFMEFAELATSSSNWKMFGTDTGEGAIAHIDSTRYVIHAFIRIRSGATVSNLTFKPMIRRVEDTDPTWQPYAKTNKELTDDSANKVDLSNIKVTGSTNNSGATITSGTFFYKSGTLVRAKVDIANGATLTQNTNYEVVTAGGLNALNNDLSNLSYQEYTKDSPTVHITATGGIYDFYAIRIGKLLKVRATLGYGSTGAVGITFDDLSFNKESGGSVPNVLACDYTSNSVTAIRINLASAIAGSHNQSFAIGGRSSNAFLVLDTVFLLDAYGVE